MTGTLADIQDKCNLLKCQIELFQAIQDVHMPVLVQYQNGETAVPRAEPPSESISDHSSHLPAQSSMPSTQTPTPTPVMTADKASTMKVEDTPLLLPSYLAASLCLSLTPGLVGKEHCLQIAQADDGLKEIQCI